jgi:hypothetical protein
VHGVEHQRRVVVQKGEKSANHGLISAVVELHLRLNYSIARAYSQLKRFGTDIPGPQPSVTTEHTFRWHRRSVQVPCDSADPHRRHSLPTRLSNLAGPLKKEKPPVSFSGVGASTGALCQSPTARERARRQQRGGEVRDVAQSCGPLVLPRGRTSPNVISPRTATREMLPNFAKFGYSGDEFWGADGQSLPTTIAHSVDPKICLSLHSTAPHLRMLRARYSGTDSVGDRYDDGVTAAVVAPRVFCA